MTWPRTEFWRTTGLRLGSQTKSFLFKVSPTEHASSGVAFVHTLKSGITHPYPNFLVLAMGGTPSFPPGALRLCNASPGV